MIATIEQVFTEICSRKLGLHPEMRLPAGQTYTDLQSVYDSVTVWRDAAGNIVAAPSLTRRSRLCCSRSARLLRRLRVRQRTRTGTPARSTLRSSA
jgi:hypothetical protein